MRLQRRQPVGQPGLLPALGLRILTPQQLFPHEGLQRDSRQHVGRQGVQVEIGPVVQHELPVGAENGEPIRQGLDGSLQHGAGRLGLGGKVLQLPCLAPFFRDVGLDGDVSVEKAFSRQDRLNVQVQPVLPARLAAIQDLGLDRPPGVQAGADAVDGRRVRALELQQFSGPPPHHLLQRVARGAREGFVHPLDALPGVRDDDEIRRPPGHLRQAVQHARVAGVGTGIAHHHARPRSSSR